MVGELLQRHVKVVHGGFGLQRLGVEKVQHLEGRRRLRRNVGGGIPAAAEKLDIVLAVCSLALASTIVDADLVDAVGVKNDEGCGGGSGAHAAVVTKLDSQTQLLQWFFGEAVAVPGL